ncbi:hypothetical protein KFL_005250035 [Klebsormidium nitens]|uniref:Uncharacterized protein n=1 Tax=Klebsormidium nitens TaxID=105231 RepID=A0A1Y1IFP6_KLENI|nr:hypothetical protein KFL_005250035 [Klebsormidium nitens]|eukprot:GAQ89453.1 hypothetical protein KFL_005250035 [Klebsormidium nitens]
MRDQRRQEPPRVLVYEDGVQPVPAPDPEACEQVVPPPEDENWEELPQAFMVDHHASPEEQSANAQATHYRENEMIWATDDNHTRMFGDEKWLRVLLLFGGIAAELEALLKAGVNIKQVVYVDNDPGFSRANRQARGLEDPRSSLYLEAVRVLATIQRLQRPWGHEPGYIFEMVDASDHASPPARWGFQQMELISGGYAGSGIRLDAAKLGSAAHRTRVFWTNLARATDIQERYTQFDRDQVWDRLDAQDALDNFRAVQLAAQDDPAVPGYYRVNMKGEPLQGFPTLVATPSSYAFRFQANQPGPGMVYDRNVRKWQEPNADERERIMGMLPGSTRGYNVPEAERRRLIGSATDVRA